MLLVFGIWISGWVPFKREVTVYRVECNAALNDGSCSENGWLPAGPTIFRANSDSNTVVHWEDGQPPAKYENCAVADPENWSCTTHYDTGTSSYYQMINGNFSDLPADGSSIRSVPKWRWWLLKAKKW